MKYAETTTVPSDRSRAEIERLLARYGASRFMYGWDLESAVIAFEMNSRRIQFRLPLPDKNADEFTQTPTGRKRAESQANEAYEQAVRQRWRALALVIKAKLEAVDAGITEFEDEFLAHIVLPSGETIGHWMRPQIETSYRSGTMPPLLPAPEKS